MLIRTDKFGTIGIYSGIPLQGEKNKWANDPDVFHFNLNERKCYYPLDKDKQEIECTVVDKKSMGRFGNSLTGFSEIKIWDKCMSKIDNVYKPGTSAFYK